MQRRRSVRKIIQEPNAVINKTNIQRRNQSSKIVRTTNNQAIPPLRLNTLLYLNYFLKKLFILSEVAHH